MSSTRTEDLEAQVASLERRLSTWVAARGSVWAVVYGNYEPPELDSLWNSEQAARERAAELGDDWQVCRFTVHEKGDVIDE